MSQGFDGRPGGPGTGFGLLPKPSAPPRSPTFREEPTSSESGPSAPRAPNGSPSRLPPVSAPPRKGSEPGFSGGLGGDAEARKSRPGGPPPLRPRSPTLPPISAPPRKSGEFNETVTRVRPGEASAPIGPDTIREDVEVIEHRARGMLGAPSRATGPSQRMASEPLEWTDDEESTHVYETTSSMPPPPAPSVNGFRPRVVPPANLSKSTLVGLAPSPPRPSHLSNGHALAGSQAPHSLAGRAGVMVDPLSFDSPGDDATTAHRDDPSRTESLPGGSPLAEPSSMRGLRPQLTGEARFPAAAPTGFSNAPGVGVASSSIEPVAPLDDGAAFVKLPQGRYGAATEMAARRPIVQAAQEKRTLASSKSIIAIALATAAISAAAMGMFLYLRRPANVEVQVTDERGAGVATVEVHVDGKKVCDTTPCILRDVAPGSKSIRVLAKGFVDEQPRTVDISAGADQKVAFALKAAAGSLSVQGDQPGVRVFVDGVDRGPLPAKLTDLAIGSHQIRIAGDRYTSIEKTIDVQGGSIVELGTMKLNVARGKVTVDVKSEEVSIFLVPNDDLNRAKTLRGPFPKPIEVETGSVTWKLVARKKGFSDFVRPLDFSDGVAEKTMNVDFAESSLPTTQDPVASVTPTPGPGPGPGTSRPPVTPDPPPDESASESKGSATLNINSLPVSRILLDGSPLGETPKTGVQVSAGTHTVTFVNPEHGKKSVSVTVKAGETKPVTVRFKKSD